MKSRKPGLQHKWSYVVNSLQEIVGSYEKASSRISLHADRRMRPEAVDFVVRKGDRVLDLGSGPGTMSRLVARAGGSPVLVDASRAMLRASGFANVVQAIFEHLPFREGAFDGGVSGFALRDAHDLHRALLEVARVTAPGGRFAICDLGKPDNPMKALGVAYYIRTMPSIIGLASVGRSGLRYGSLFDTYALVLHNSQLASTLSHFIGPTELHETQFGGSIVAKCVRKQGALPLP